MIRKSLLLALALFAIPMFAQAARGPASLRKFVQGFYDWYVPLALKNNEGPAFNMALEQKSFVFSPQLLHALKEDSKAQAESTGEIVGLDWDPFLNSQDPESHYAVGSITKKADSFLVNIHGVRSGKRNEKPDIVAELMQKNSHWLFVNFHSIGGWDLLTTLKELQNSRESNSK